MTFFWSCRLAMIVTLSDVLTGWVVIGKVALLPPPGIVTKSGTFASCGFEVARLTTNPPGGALQPGMSATVPWRVFPPVTVVDERLNV